MEKMEQEEEEDMMERRAAAAAGLGRPAVRGVRERGTKLQMVHQILP